MTILKYTNWSFSLILLLLILASLAPNSNAQATPATVRERVVIFLASRPCDPAQVRMFSLGLQPVDAVLAQVAVENRSQKTITAVKLRWHVYDERNGHNLSLASCTVDFPIPQSLLTGTTEAIQLPALNPRHTYTIGINQLPVPSTQNDAVFVNRPFVTVDDLRSLITNTEGPAVKYALVIFVAEIQYKDGTNWTGGIP
jgi:hypothetical protein